MTAPVIQNYEEHNEMSLNELDICFINYHVDEVKDGGNEELSIFMFGNQAEPKVIYEFIIKNEKRAITIDTIMR